MGSTIGSTSVNPYLSLFKGIWARDRISGITGSLSLPSNVVSRQKTYNDNTFQSVLQRFNQKTRSLYESLNSFSWNAEDLPRNFRTAVISDADAEKIAADVTSDATVTSYLVDVDRMATVKTRQSKTLVSDDPSGLAEGAHAFILEAGENSYALDISVDTIGDDRDTNKDVLRKIKWAIDSTGEDVDTEIIEIKRKKYSVFSDNLYENVSYLTISSKNTGDMTDFYLQDSSGDIVASLDLNKTIQTARKSAYKIDTHASTSSGNTVSTDSDNLSITFLDTTDESARIRVRKGLAPVAEKVVHMISTYNDYMDWLDLNSQYINVNLKSNIYRDIESLGGTVENTGAIKDIVVGTGRLSATIRINHNDTERGTLSKIGLNLKENGQIEIADTFSKALEDKYEMVGQILAGDDGVFSRLKDALKNILDMGTEKYGLSQSRDTTYNQQGYLSPLNSMMAQGRRFSLFV